MRRDLVNFAYLLTLLAFLASFMPFIGLEALYYRCVEYDWRKCLKRIYSSSYKAPA
jgi:hypothetical protein